MAKHTARIDVPMAIEKWGPEGKDIVSLLARTKCDDPDPEDVTELRRVLREVPGLWKTIADMAEITGDELITMTGGCVALVEALKRGRTVMKKELGYETATALERLLIESLYLAWLRYMQAERLLTNTLSDRRLTLTQVQWWDKNLTAAQRRYLRACETLARIRKMRLPPIQVNIATQGGQQVKRTGEGGS